MVKIHPPCIKHNVLEVNQPLNRAENVMSKTIFKKAATLLALGGCMVGLSTPAAAQDTTVVIGMSGWTGFAPLTLADKAGLLNPA